MASKCPLFRQVLGFAYLASAFFLGALPAWATSETTKDPFEIRLPSPLPYDADRQAAHRSKAAWQNFYRRHPLWNVLFDEHTGQPHRMFGPAINLPGWSGSADPSNPENLQACLSFLQKEIVLFTGLPTKDETLETTVRNLYCLFPYIHDSLQL